MEGLTIYKLSALDITTLKEILHDHNPHFHNDDLLALYAITGGVPKYLELLCDSGKVTVDKMIDFVAHDNSPFIDEGRNLLIEEFGRNYSTYFSILSAISGGINTQPRIEAALGDKSVGGQLKRLIEDYDIIARVRPILAKEGTQTVRYEIKGHFTRFWFNYFDRHRMLIEIKNFKALQAIIRNDYPTYSGKILELYFKQMFAESMEYRDIGSWWQPKGEGNEIDIVGLKLNPNHAVAVEVKRQKRISNPHCLPKSGAPKSKLLPKYNIDMLCLSLDDM